MPPSRQVRARQNRQKERIAVAHAEQRRVHRRRRIVGGIVAALVVVGVVIAGYEIQQSGNNSSSVATNTPDTSSADSTPTTAALASAKGKPCVAMADTPPKGAPSVPVQVGPPPKTLVVKDLKPGTGAVIPKGATITANYIGVSCSTGKIFDSSWAHGGPAQFSLNQVIPGWTAGIPGMRVGGVRLLGIPSDQGYGAAGYPPGIAPDEALWFVVQPTKVS